jgi:FkbM family methyltransferase
MRSVEYELLMLAAQALAQESRLNDQHDPNRTLVTQRLEQAFASLVRLIAPPTIVEIGALDARFSRNCRKFAPSARIVALEGNPSVFARFRDRVLADNVEYLNKAVADTDGTVVIRAPLREDKAEIPGMTSLLPGRWFSDYNLYETPSVRVDTLLGAAASAPSALWIDVEGAIGLVLAGAETTLASCALLYAELEPSDKMWPGQMLDVEVIRRLAEFGLVPVLRDVYRQDWQYNALFVRDALLSDAEVVAEIKRNMIF